MKIYVIIIFLGNGNRIAGKKKQIKMKHIFAYYDIYKANRHGHAILFTIFYPNTVYLQYLVT